ncbi:MAG: hypothetical protein ACI4DN_04315 [Lachnospiraceae bacterium]
MDRQNTVGFLASSLAGHDLDKIYVVIGEEGEYLLLADGRIRMVNHPKKKKKKHVQLIKYCSDRILPDNLYENKIFSDLDVKRMIKDYEKIRSKKDS